MKYTLIWAALALLVLAAWWSIGHKEGSTGVGLSKGGPGSEAHVDLLGERLGLQVRQAEVVDDLTLPVVQEEEAKVDENVQPYTKRFLRPDQVEEGHRGVLPSEYCWWLSYLQQREAEVVVDENEITRYYTRCPEWPDMRVAASEMAAYTGSSPSGSGDEGWLVTFYSCTCRDLTTCIPEGFCGKMRSGVTVYEGAAACDPRLTGSAVSLVLAGRVLECMDTGAMVRGRHVDVFFYYQEDGWEFLRQWGDRQIVEVINGD